MSRRPWSIWIDTGGTFTDCLARAPDGSIHRAKVLSSGCLRGKVERVDGSTVLIAGPWGDSASFLRGFRIRRQGGREEETFLVADVSSDGRLHLGGTGEENPFSAGTTVEVLSGEPAPILAARLVTGTPPGRPLPEIELRLATTKGTNALLERKGAETALVVSRGFRDLLRIGTQQRPDLFSLRTHRPPPLPGLTLEVGGRIDPEGAVTEPLDPAEIESVARAIADSGCEAVAVSLINAYANPVHEHRLGNALCALGVENVTLGTDLSRSLHYLNRTRTAVINAYLAPILEDYLDDVSRALGDGSGIRIMTSAGGLADRSAFRPRDSLLSGPAAGVVGALSAGLSAGFDTLISFDMGGTSTDISRIDREIEYRWTHTVGDAELVAPSVAIETVAAGGGSVCGYRLGALFVGPESAGASPGPACYGGGGPLTVTDCNLLLGRLDPDRFEIPLDVDAAQRALRQVRARMTKDGQPVESEADLLEGFVALANERMAEAVRGVSVRKGFDPADHALVAFGGAGGQHACAIAERLGIRSVVVPADPALLSARGLAMASREEIAERQILQPLEDGSFLEPIFEELRQEALAGLGTDMPDSDIFAVSRRIADLRLLGQETTISLEVARGHDLPSTFFTRYRDLYGYAPADHPVEVESVRVVVRDPPRGEGFLTSPGDATSGEDRTPGTRSVWFRGEWVEVPTISRSALNSSPFQGPALILDPYSTILLPPSWTIKADQDGSLLLRAQKLSLPTIGMATQEAVRQELFTSRFESLVDQMGDQLLRTASSVNIKERMDFSCALLDARGELIANAPHIPVHLGALGLCIRTVAETTDMVADDVVVTNDPRFGGSHLPDVTVITPVFADESKRLIGFVANRAHHAEIGGTRPGSMPPDAEHLEEEGVVIPPTRIIEAGQARWEKMEEIFRSGRHGSRAPAENIADLRAQVAANHRGAKLLKGLAAEHGESEVARQMELLAQRAAKLATEALSRVGSRDRMAVEELDDGNRLAIRIRIDEGRAFFDFTGTSSVHPGNLNATPAIVRSTVLYVLRLLVAEDIPLNEGLLRPVTIQLPECLLNPPFAEDPARSPAIVGGNTEVSQRLTDALIRALDLTACSQGTMNNVLFGNSRFGFYETIAGGAGAGEGFEGESGVHSHMTNTRITDAEVIEFRYPVRILETAIRRGSAGSGRWRGGEGIRRIMEFAEAVDLSVLSQHRRVAPFGMRGGGPGGVGRQWIEKPGGERVMLGGIAAAQMEVGDRLTIETPGGGGWGSAAGESEGST